MRIKFLGAAGTVTGSCHLIEAGSTRVLVDCGMFQGSRVYRERNYQRFSVDPSTVDCILLTHAHIDHSGLIPKIIRNGFRGKVYATSATTDLCSVMLPDSGYIQEMEVERLNRRNRRSGKPLLSPIYTADDAINSLRFFEKVNYNDMLDLTPEIKARFISAGHILGSAMLEIWVRGGAGQTKFVFTGDLGGRNNHFVGNPAVVTEADYLIMESTYGSRLHGDNASKRKEILYDVLWETYHKGGNLIIPAFAVERTQDLLYDINLLFREGRFPHMDIYIDSPMAIAATEVFKNHQSIFDSEARSMMGGDFNPFDMPMLKYSRTTEESVALNDISGAVIISASGMCDAGRIKHHLRHNLWRPESTVLFVGFQAQGTKGRQILDGAKFVRIYGEEIKVQADIREIDGYSSHADQGELLEWLGNFHEMPGNIFLVHGEQESASTLAGLIKERYGAEPVIPQWLDSYEITPGINFTEEQLLQANAAVSAKLQQLLETGIGQDNYNDIMKRLNELNGLIERLSKKETA
ncbi:MAG: MBL fold metallo-hydrolase RNA specificity domain-containing protein [Bacillota bacterium]